MDSVKRLVGFKIRPFKLLQSTVNSRFKKDLNLQIHLHEAFFQDHQFLESVHKYFFNQTTLNLRKEKWRFLNQELTVLIWDQNM